MHRRAGLKAAMKLVAALGCAATVACNGNDLVAPEPSRAYGSMFDDLWSQFDLHYSYFDLKDLDWTAIGEHYRPLAMGAASDAQFASVLGQMVSQLHDLHVSITAGKTLYRFESPYEATSAINETAIFARYVPSSFKTSGGHIRAGLIAPRVGYARITSFVGDDWSGEFDEVLTRIGEVDAVIVDVRDNSGGSKTIATKVAGRFADRERTFGFVRLRNGAKHDQFSDDIAETVKPEGARHHAGRVVVLSNRGCMSAAEDFVLAMHSLPTATIVGDTTIGASGGPLVRELANGWTYQLSQWVAFTADHKTFEGIGLAPDVYVKSGSSTSTTDVVLERAIQLAK
jgi:carboxyl-terminal processing protease